MIKDYLVFGLGIYVGCASARSYLIRQATPLKVLLGLLLILVWPVALYLSWREGLQGR